MSRPLVLGPRISLQPRGSSLAPWGPASSVWCWGAQTGSHSLHGAPLGLSAPANIDAHTLSIFFAAKTSSFLRKPCGDQLGARQHRYVKTAARPQPEGTSPAAPGAVSFHPPAQAATGAASCLPPGTVSPLAVGDDMRL